ncbi:hypothetical protein [Streptomyces collinus]
MSGAERRLAVEYWLLVAAEDRHRAPLALPQPMHDATAARNEGIAD